MTEIDALLARLKELDRKTWIRIRRGVKIPPWIVIGCWHADMRWVIQGVIQEAAAARGLAIVIEYHVKDSDWCGAEIQEKSSGLSRIRIGPNAAEAILEAQQGASAKLDPKKPCGIDPRRLAVDDTYEGSNK